MRRRRMTLVAVAASVLVAIVGACGGGGGDGEAFDGEMVRSGDGVLTVQIPTGAAAEGVEIEVTRIAEDELPPELRGVDGVVVVGYQLGPDGAQFSQPVTLTFRVDPVDHGIDLPEGAVPLALLLTENAAGDLESLPGEVSYEDGEIVVRATVTHFSPALLVLSIHEEVALEPAEIELAVGGSREVKFVTRDPITGDKLELPYDLFEDESDWSTTPPFTVIRSEKLTATISCTAPTDGWVLDAYRVLVPTYFTAFFDEEAEFFGTIAGLRGVLGAFGEPLGIKLAGKGKCSGPASSTSPAGSSGETSSGESSSGTSASAGGPAETAELVGCEARREQQIVLDFSSPTINPTIPLRYFKSEAYASGFPTPPFRWSTVPPETTEIAILIMSITDERAADYLRDAKLWWNQSPLGKERWVLTGLDPSLTSLPLTSLTSPPPDGAVEQLNGSANVVVDGVSMPNKFVGPDINGRDFLFAVFALCDPRSFSRAPFVRDLQQNAIAIGWFFAEAQQ